MGDGGSVGGTQTRRRFIGRGGIVAAGAAAVSVPLASTATSASAPSPTLTAERRRTYAALVQAVGSSPGTLVEATDARSATNALARHYRNASASTQLRINSILDELESDGFSRKTTRARLSYLRKQLGREQSKGGELLGTLVGEAVSLAAAPFNPSGFAWSAASAQTWLRVNR